MILDDKKIEAAARRYSEVTDCTKEEALLIEEGFKAGAHWAINEFLKDLVHPASEVPRNDNGKILVFSKVNSNMNAMLNETACYTYQGKWEVRVREYTFTDLAFVEDLLDLIKKGGKHD